MTESSTWHYVGKADSQRILALEAPRPASELPEALSTELSLVCYHRDPRHNVPLFERAVFCGVVAPEVFDWFFNARTGYRGAYFESIDAGIRANASLIDYLAPRLADWALAKGNEHNKEWILKSLKQTSAKAWLAEQPGLCALCVGEWSPASSSDLRIENGRWESSTHVHAEWGRQAPQLTKIRIFGGLIDGGGNEWVAPHKAD